MMRNICTLIIMLCLGSTGLSQDIDALLLDAKYDQAITQIDAALAKTTNANAVLALRNKKAEALLRQGKFQDAELLLQELQTLKNLAPEQLASIQSTFGLLYLNQGRNEQALESLQQAITGFEKANKSNSLEAAEALAHLGNTYRTIGQYTKAEEQLMMALNILQKQPKVNSERVAAIYNDLGLIYAYGLLDYDKAFDNYDKSRSIYQKLHGNDHPKVAIAYTNIAYVYRGIELYGDAVNNYEAALKSWEKIYPQPHPNKAFVLYNLGITYQAIANQKGANADQTAAKGYYDRALSMYEQSYAGKHPDIARVRNTIGILDLASGNFDIALEQFQKAIQANVPGFNANDPGINPALINFYDGNVLVQSMMYKARSLETRHFRRTLKMTDLDLAIATLQKCDTLIDILRQQINNEADKISLGSVATDVYADGVRITHEGALVAFKKKPYHELCFYFAEKSKSAVLLEAISDTQAKSFAGIPANLLEEERDLKSALALCQQKLAQGPAAEEEKRLRETAYKLNRNYEAFVRKLEGEFPEYFNLKFNTSSPTMEDVQQKLDDQTALLSYFIDERNARLYVFQILKSKHRIIDRALPPDFDRAITGMRNAIYFNVPNIFRQTAEELSPVLLPKALPKNITNLIILPTGRLSILPFETLFTEKTDSTQTYANFPYWANTYSIRYEFSAGLILQKATKKTTITTPSIFLCAPVNFDKDTGLDNLPGTESEVKEIAKLFNSRNLTSSLYLHQQADEKLLKSGELKKFSHLHLATHGVVDENDPQLSRIFLLEGAGKTEDGNLYAGEIYNLNLNAKLVTLSACQTGLGKISKGEGVIGLSRALVFAGAQNILVTFWSVSDESTAELMKDFYQQMLEHPDQSFSQNLQVAKQHLKSNELYAAPYFWAPFILIGF